MSAAAVVDAIPGNSYKIMFPIIEPKSGMFASYMVISIGGKTPAVTNQLGVAQGMPDSSVVLTVRQAAHCCCCCACRTWPFAPTFRLPRVSCLPALHAYVGHSDYL